MFSLAGRNFPADRGRGKRKRERAGRGWGVGGVCSCVCEQVTLALQRELEGEVRRAERDDERQTAEERETEQGRQTV